jgi:probable glucitol transport protein GutA
MKAKSETAETGKRQFPFGRFMAWKTSDISAAGLNIIIMTYLTIYLTNYLGMSGTLVGTILLVSNIVDAITDLIAGFIIDRTHSKLGKGRPYELGIVGMWVCTFLMFATPAGASQTLKAIWVFFMYTFVFGVFNTLRGAAQTPYMIRAFHNDKKLVGQVCSYGGIVTTIGSMAVSLTFPILMGRIATNASGWTALVAIYAAPLCVIALGRFVFVKEDPVVDVGNVHVKATFKDFLQVFTKNKYVWAYAGLIFIFNTLQNISAQSYYFTYIAGNTDLLGTVSIMGIMLLPVMLVMPLILKKISVSKVIIIGACIAIVGYAANFFAGGNGGMLIGAAILMGCLNLPVSYLCAVLLMDLFDYNEYKGMARLEGTTNQLAHGISSQLGQGVGGFLLGICLDVSGFITTTEGTVAQPESALTMVKYLYSFIPVVLCVILIVCVFFLGKLDKHMPEIEKTLAEKRAAIAEAANSSNAAPNSAN